MIVGTNIITTTVGVTLTDVGPLERPYHSSRIIPTTMTVIYRAGEGVDQGGLWQLFAIELRGNTAKKDGSPSKNDAEDRYSVGPWSNQLDLLPAELVEYARAHVPTTYPADWLHAVEESR